MKPKTQTQTQTTAVTLPLGGITLIDKVEKDFGLISGVFSCISSKARNFEARVKLLLYNRLTMLFLFTAFWKPTRKKSLKS